MNVQKFHAFKTNHIVQFEGGLYGKIKYIFVTNIYDISNYFCLVYPVMFHDTDKSLQSSIWKATGTKHIPGADMPVVVPLMFFEHFTSILRAIYAGTRSHLSMNYFGGTIGTLEDIDWWCGRAGREGRAISQCGRAGHEARMYMVV